VQWGLRSTTEGGFRELRRRHFDARSNALSEFPGSPKGGFFQAAQLEGVILAAGELLAEESARCAECIGGGLPEK